MNQNSIQLISHSAQETHQIGWQIGQRIHHGLVIALTGTLGSGKTALVQGLAKGLGVAPGCPVTSPTYTLINEYPARCRLYHVDLYRLSGFIDTDELGFREIINPHSVVAIEWAEHLPPGELPRETLHIVLSIRPDTFREIEISSQVPSLLNHFIDIQQTI